MDQETYITQQFMARGFVVESVNVTEDEVIEVETDRGLYVMEIGSDDDEYTFTNDADVVTFPIDAPIAP